MKTRGTRGGILLSPEAQDNPASLQTVFNHHRNLFSGKVYLEVADRLSWTVVQTLADKVAEAGGEIVELRPAAVPSHAPAKRDAPPPGDTVIVPRTLRSGGRVESAGSVVILGDVNAGAEIVAADNIIVLGILRGLAHAGAAGNHQAIIWAQHILSPQLRIADALAQAGGDVAGAKGPEVAQLVEGQIVLKPWG